MVTGLLLAVGGGPPSLRSISLNRTACAAGHLPYRFIPGFKHSLNAFPRARDAFLLKLNPAGGVLGVATYGSPATDEIA
jgi:hypothetical protein